MSQTIDDNVVLAKLGYKPELKRDFSPFEVFGLGFAIIGVLPSIASVLLYSVPYGGPVSMVWGWAVCTFFLTFIAIAIAELGSAAPTAGGVYYWTFMYSPPKYRNFLCWLVGYLNSLTYVSAISGVNWGCAVQITAAASIGSDFTYIPTVYHTYGVFVAVTISHAIIVSFATKVVARLQNIFIIVNIAIAVGVIIGMPAGSSDHVKNSAAFAFGHLENLSGWPNGFAFILGFLAPLWVVGGFDSTVHLSEEARNANVAIPWAIVSSIVVSTIIGWGINVALAFNMGQDIGAIVSNEIGQPLATIFFNSFGKLGTLALWTFLIISQYMMGVGIVTTTSRQIFAFSRDGALPFSKTLYNVNRRMGVPVRAVWFSAFIAILITLIPLAGPAASGALFSMAVVGQYTANATVITLRWMGGQEFTPGPFYTGKFSRPISFVAVLWMYFMAVVLLFPAEPNVTRSTMNYTVLVCGGVLLLSSIYYVANGKKWFKGPVVTIEEGLDLDTEKEA